MEAPLQQRIVGAIVLVTLGVIFIPALLDGSGYKSRQVQDIEIREKPEFPPLTQKKLKPIVTPLEKIKKSQVAALKSAPEKPHKKLIKSFAVHKTQSKGKTSYKLRIGPELEYSVLEKIKKDVKKSHKIDAYIVNHP